MQKLFTALPFQGSPLQEEEEAPPPLHLLVSATSLELSVNLIIELNARGAEQMIDLGFVESVLSLWI